MSKVTTERSGKEDQKMVKILRRIWDGYTYFIGWLTRMTEVEVIPFVFIIAGVWMLAVAFLLKAAGK
jgi:hypothetical protein